MKRLFLFAAYDRDGTVDDTLTYYLGELSKLGDLVVVMDNGTTDNELAKIKSIPNVLYATATRHGEYDFGSYKRAYQYARDNKILENYDWIYLVNDSCYLLHSPEKMLCFLENSGHKMIGAVENDRWLHHIQSFFIGLAPEIFTTSWFDGFMNGIHHEKDKGTIVLKYEVGLSKLVLQHGFSFKGYTNQILHSYKYLSEQHLIPLMKKMIVSQNNILWYQNKIKQTLKNVSEPIKQKIQSNILRTKNIKVPLSWPSVFIRTIKNTIIHVNKAGYLCVLHIPIYKTDKKIHSTTFYVFPIKLKISWSRRGYLLRLWGHRLFRIQRKANAVSMRTINKYHKEHLKNKCSGCIYTCLTGAYDKLPTHKYLNPQYDYICFTDNADLLKNGHSVWQIRPLPFTKGDRITNSRFPKLNPHLVVGNYNHSVYVDANIDIVTDKLFRTCENSSKDIMIPKHNDRDCLYAEVKVVYEKDKDTADNLFKAYKVFYENGFPQNFGLAENNIIYRKHTPEIQQIDEQWWNMFMQYSKRDQLSLGYILWKNNRSFQDMYMPIQQGWDYMVNKHEK